MKTLILMIVVLFSSTITTTTPLSTIGRLDNIRVDHNTPSISENPIETRFNSIDVTVTVYHAVVGQCDDTPLITADNSVIDTTRTTDLRWVALSRNLLKRWGGDINYGDKVYVYGISKELDGIYEVHDTMNSRYKNYVDILVDKDSGIYNKWQNIKIRKVN